MIGKPGGGDSEEFVAYGFVMHEVSEFMDGIGSLRRAILAGIAEFPFPEAAESDAFLTFDPASGERCRG